MLECSVKGNKNDIPTFPLKCPSILLYAEYSVLFDGTLKLKAIKYNFKYWFVDFFMIFRYFSIISGSLAMVCALWNLDITSTGKGTFTHIISTLLFLFLFL